MQKMNRITSTINNQSNKRVPLNS